MCVTNPLFKNIFNNIDNYHLCENFWIETWINNCQKKENWSYPWLNNNFINGEKILDANPIFSAINNKEKKSIRIIIDEENIRYFSYNDFFDHLNIKELVIVCNMKKKHVEEAKEDIFKWSN